MKARLRRPNLRMRLTLVYGGLFLLAGMFLIFLVYFLVESNIPTGDVIPQPPAAGAPDAPDAPDAGIEHRGALGERFRELLDRQRARVLDTLVQQSIVALAITTIAAAAL